MKWIASESTKFLIIIAIMTVLSITVMAQHQARTPRQLPKVFQIGFNKCGTTTLSDFFNANGIPSVHYDYGDLAISIEDNYKNNRPLITGIYTNYTGFFDMQNIHTDPPIFIAQQLYKELDKQYPGSKFILNTRDKAAWLRSRSRHDTRYGMTYLEFSALKYNVTTEQMLQTWSKEWDDHFQAANEYFKNRPEDFIVFDIEQDPPEKLCKFFRYDFKLNPKLYEHKNKTS